MYHQPTIINELIKNIIKQSPHQHKLQEANIINTWHQVLPSLISRRTSRIYLKQNKIFVKIDSAPLRQELQNTKQHILKTLQDSVKDYEIIDLVFIG
jgi:hypothetical protein